MENKIKWILIPLIFLIISLFYLAITRYILNDNLDFGKVDDIFLILSISFFAYAYLWKKDGK